MQIFGNILDFMNSLKLQPVTFISLFIAYYSYKRSTRKKEVLYTKVNVKVFQNCNKKISDFVSKYKNKSVNSITVTRYLVWNNSAQAIRKNDIAPRDPLQFSVNDSYEILDKEIIYPKDSLNGFMLSNQKRTNNFTKLSFDFINKDEGVIIQIIHTGKTKNIRFTGTIIDFKKPVFIEQYDKFDQIFAPILANVMPIVFFIFLLSGEFLYLVETISISAWILIFIMAVSSVNILVTYTRRLIPKKFRLTFYKNCK